MDDWLLYFMNDLLMFFVDDWLMNLPNFLFVNDGNMVLMNDILMLLMDDILMMLVSNILMMLMDDFSVVLFDYGCSSMHFNFCWKNILLNNGGHRVLFEFSLFIMSDDGGCCVVGSLNYGRLSSHRLHLLSSHLDILKVLLI